LKPDAIERIGIIIDIQNGRMLYRTRDVVHIPVDQFKNVRKLVRQEWEKGVLAYQRFTKLYDLGAKLLIGEMHEGFTHGT
jgi:hypothetical protein